MSDDAIGPEWGDVTLGKRTYRVTVTSETVRRTVYTVTCPGDRARSWHPAEVRVGAESVFACLSCLRHPKDPCIHVEIVKRYVAAQPLVAVPTAPET